MMQSTLSMFIFRGIPEGILGLYAVYVFAGKKMEWGRIVICGLLFALITYFIRMLPIQFGVHTVLGLVVLIVIANQINRIHIIRAVTASILYIMLLFASEAVSYPVVTAVTKVSLAQIAQDPVKIVALGSFSLVPVIIVIVLTHIIKMKMQKKGI